MNGIKSYQLVREKGNYVLVIYLDHIDAEFGNELGEINPNKKENFYEEIKNHIQTKFPRIHIPLVKVMLGTILVASIPIAATTQSHAATIEQSTFNYQVASGDTLWRISQKFGVSVTALKTNNNLTSDTIQIGTTLKIPNTTAIQPTLYTVKLGDTLYGISKTYGATVDQIKTTNGLTSDLLAVGQTLTIPKTSTTTTPVASPTIPKTYSVQSGDTLWKISNMFGISVTQIKQYNNMVTESIVAGQVLKLTAVATSTQPTITYMDYQIQSGDNLWKIAINNSIPMSELMQVNNLNESSALKIGQIIRVPVHFIPIKETAGAQYGEYLDWWTEAQYVVPINKVFKVTDMATGKSFTIKRTIGANHADSEPMTYTDTEIAKSVWGGFSWNVRPVIITVDGRRIAASMSFMPHGIEYIANNNFDGHFDIHFLNSTRHVDGLIDINHQNAIKIAAGVGTI